MSHILQKSIYLPGLACIQQTFVDFHRVLYTVDLSNNMATKRVNQFGEKDDRPMTNERWVEKWSEGKTRFHRPSVNP